MVTTWAWSARSYSHVKILSIFQLFGGGERHYLPNLRKTIKWDFYTSKRKVVCRSLFFNLEKNLSLHDESELRYRPYLTRLSRCGGVSEKSYRLVYNLMKHPLYIIIYLHISWLQEIRPARKNHPCIVSRLLFCPLVWRAPLKKIGTLWDIICGKKGSL